MPPQPTGPTPTTFSQALHRGVCLQSTMKDKPNKSSKNSQTNEKSLSKKEKKPVHLKKPKLEPQGFLLPKPYKMTIQWKENPLYRGTFLLLLLTILCGFISLPRWIFTNEWKKSLQDYKTTSLEENQWVSTGLTKIRPLQNKYKEIDEILKYRRIPLSPILSSIQKNIPLEISLNKIQWESNLQKTTKNIDILGKKVVPQLDDIQIHNTFREAKIKLDIYATPDWDRKQSPSAWLANVEKDIKKQGIRITNRNIGTEKPYISPYNTTAKSEKKADGTTIEVSLSLELEGPKKTEGKGRPKPVLP